ncbi:hypothetical protein LguiA_014812 [Lonicera macranthoides]
MQRIHKRIQSSQLVHKGFHEQYTTARSSSSGLDWAQAGHGQEFDQFSDKYGDLLPSTWISSLDHMSALTKLSLGLSSNLKILGNKNL